MKDAMPYRLREVDVYTVIVYQDPLHLEVCLLAVLLILELDEGVLKTILSTLISNNFARYYFAKSTEYQIEIFVYKFVILDS